MKQYSSFMNTAVTKADSKAEMLRIWNINVNADMNADMNADTEYNTTQFYATLPLFFFPPSQYLEQYMSWKPSD